MSNMHVSTKDKKDVKEALEKYISYRTWLAGCNSKMEWIQEDYEDVKKLEELSKQFLEI